MVVGRVGYPGATPLASSATDLPDTGTSDQPQPEPVDAVVDRRRLATETLPEAARAGPETTRHPSAACGRGG